MNLADRMKAYEVSPRAMPLLPICVRLDGKNFSRWTRGFDKPFDPRIMRAMDWTTLALVEETNAVVAYTQSDEITLILYSDDYQSQTYFDGKIQKICSVLAALATVQFASQFNPSGEKGPALFDCRVWQVPNLVEASNVLLWRQEDAIRNSIQGLGQVHMSHRELQGMSGPAIVKTLQDRGVLWEHLSDREKQGRFVRRRRILKTLAPEVLAKIPKEKRPLGPIERSEVGFADIPPLGDLELAERLERLFRRSAGRDPHLPEV
jgi:tRNA(His) 5'-end guanylyltransferase